MGGFDDSEPAMSQPSRSASLLEYFSALSDPREGWRVLYLLPEILFWFCAPRCPVWRISWKSGCGANSGSIFFGAFCLTSVACRPTTRSTT